MQERASPRENRIDRYRVFNPISGKVEFSPSQYAIAEEGEKNLEILKNYFDRRIKNMALNLPSKKSGLNLPKAQNATAPALTLEGLAAVEEAKKVFAQGQTDILTRLEKAEKVLANVSATVEKLFQFSVNDSQNSNLILERLEKILTEIKGLPTAEIVPAQTNENVPAQTNENVPAQTNDNYPGLLAWHGDKSPAGQQKALEYILSEINGDIEKIGIVNAAMGRSLFGPRNTEKVKEMIKTHLLNNPNPAGSVQPASAGKKPIGKKDWSKILGVSAETVRVVFDSLKDAESFSSEEAEEIQAYLLQEGAREGDNLDAFLDHCENIVLGN